MTIKIWNKKDDYFTSNVDSDSRENNGKDLKEDMDENPSFQPLQMKTMAVTKLQIILNIFSS
jgi:hypothetical protein